MKTNTKILMVITVLLSAVNSFAQIKNAKTEIVKIYGNCDMCKTTIEKAGNVKNVRMVTTATAIVNTALVDVVLLHLLLVYKYQ